MNYHEERLLRVTAYTLHFNRPLALAFLKFADAFIRGSGKPITKGAIGLSNSQYSNWQNVRHFGLICQVDKGRGWHLTKLGLDFLQGKAQVLTPAAHLGGETLDEQHLAWATHPHKRELISVRDVLPEEWDAREKFKAEKRDLVA